MAPQIFIEYKTAIKDAPKWLLMQQFVDKNSHVDTLRQIEVQNHDQANFLPLKKQASSTRGPTRVQCCSKEMEQNRMKVSI